MGTEPVCVPLICKAAATLCRTTRLLELLLSISIPRKDVKPIAYALINRFGSLEQVFAAGAADLQQVPGVGEQTAVQILLVRDLNRRIRQNQNKPVKHLTDAAQSCAYFANLLRDKTTEQVYLVTLDGSAKSCKPTP